MLIRAEGESDNVDKESRVEWQALKFLFNKEIHKHLVEWSDLRKHKQLKIYSGGILTMSIQWPIASSHIAS